MHTLLSLIELFCLMHLCELTMSFKVTSLALGQSYDCPSASEVTLNDIGKIIQNLSTAKHNKTLIICMILGMYCSRVKHSLNLCHASNLYLGVIYFLHILWHIFVDKLTSRSQFNITTSFYNDMNGHLRQNVILRSSPFHGISHL